jgi:hypothetical protein
MKTVGKASSIKEGFWIVYWRERENLPSSEIE